MIREYRAKIRFKIFRSHPDYECVPQEKRDDFLEYGDVYKVDPDKFWSKESMMSYIKEDLALVAGGGYNADHIYGVTYEIERI